MYKLLQSKKKNQKGFTLVELLVTVLLMSLALTLTVQVTEAFYHRYRMTEARWYSQNAARRVMEYFNLRSESLSNSATISLFKTTKPQPPVEPASHKAELEPKVMQGVPNQGNSTYAYIYAQSPSPTDPSSGNLIYVLERNRSVKNPDGTMTEVVSTPVSLTQYILKEDVPLDISFQVSTRPIEVEKQDGEDGPTYVYGHGEDKYLRTTVDVIISTPKSVGGNYKLTTSFTMNNMTSNQRVNYEGEDITPTTPGDPTIGIAGWTNAAINATECPTTIDKHPFAHDPANILRYVSVQSFLESANGNAADIDIQKAGCFGTLSMQGSAIESQVLNSLRDFRDNVLSKTKLGNKIIDAYYTSWSPALVEMAQENPTLLKVGKCVLVPTSLFAMLLAD